MSLYGRTVKPQHLRFLRDSKKLSPAEMAEKLNELIGYGGKYDDKNKGLVLDQKSGRQTISHLENGHRRITPEIALAYAEIFETSLDYVYGLIDDPKQQFLSLRDYGLTDRAIKAF